MSTASRIRLRLRIEIGLAIASVVLAGVTLIWPNWIELLFEAEPDGGDGSLERAISLVFILAAAVFSLFARMDSRRLSQTREATRRA